MMMDPWKKTIREIETVPCPVCKAEPTRPCKEEGGIPVVHVARFDFYNEEQEKSRLSENK